MAYALSQFITTASNYSGNIEVDGVLEPVSISTLFQMMFPTASAGATNTGYLLRIWHSASSGAVAALYRLTAGAASFPTSYTLSGTAVDSTTPRSFKFRYHVKSGKFEIWVSGVLIFVATDVTYTINGPIGYGVNSAIAGAFLSGLTISGGHSGMHPDNKDANDRAKIDLSQTHFNKDIDSLNDNVYARPLASRISSGKPLIDFSEAIHIGKNLLNIADDPGGTWRRIAGIDSSNHAVTSSLAAQAVTNLATATLASSAAIAFAGTALGNIVNNGAYAQGQMLKPTNSNAGGYVFQCTNPGQAAATAQTTTTWPQTVGSSVTTGGATFINIGVLNAYSTYVQILSLSLTINSVNDPIRVKMKGDFAFSSFQPKDEVDYQMDSSPDNSVWTNRDSGRVVIGSQSSLISSGEGSGPIYDFTLPASTLAALGTAGIMYFRIRFQLVNGATGNLAGFVIDDAQMTVEDVRN